MAPRKKPVVTETADSEKALPAVSVFNVMVDDGSSNIKLAWNNTKNDKVELKEIPSRYRMSAQIQFDTYSDTAFENGTADCSYDPNYFDTEETTNQDYQFSLGNYVCVMQALTETGLKGEINLTVTLPANMFFSDKKGGGLLHSNIDRKIEHIKGLDFPRFRRKNKKQLGFTIGEVRVLPEGLPAALHCVQEVDALKAIAAEDGLFLMIDIGWTTSDLICVSSKGQVYAFASLNHGISNVYASFKENMEELDFFRGQENPQKRVRKYMENAIHRHEQLAAHPEVAEKLQTFADEALDGFVASLKKDIEAHGDFKTLSSYDAVILSGGGSNYLSSKVSLFGNNAHAPERPHFHNALGGLMMMSKGKK